jgi:hypothetical protein
MARVLTSTEEALCYSLAIGPRFFRVNKIEQRQNRVFLHS